METTLLHVTPDLDGSIVDLDAILPDDIANVVEEIGNVLLDHHSNDAIHDVDAKLLLLLLVLLFPLLSVLANHHPLMLVLPTMCI